MKTRNSKTGTKSRIMALLLTFAMILGVCPSAFAELQINSASCLINGAGTANVQTGTMMTLSVSASINDTNMTDNGPLNPQPEIRIYIGDMQGVKLTSFTPDGGKSVGDRFSMDAITYTVQKDEKGFYLLVTPNDGEWNSGDTFGLNTGAMFTADANKEWNVELVCIANPAAPDPKTLAGCTATPISDVAINNSKQASRERISIPAVSGATTLTKDLMYDINAYTGETLNDSTSLNYGEAVVKSMTITDTLTLPDGLYIAASADTDDARKAAIKAAYELKTGTVAADYEITNIVYSGTEIKGFTFTYTKTNDNINKQMSPISLKATLKGANVQVKDTYTYTEYDDTENVHRIKNTLHTVAVLANGETKSPTDVSVDTIIRRNKDNERQNFIKTIRSVSQQASTKTYDSWNKTGYVVKGDYIIYEISYEMTGDAGLNNDVVTDSLPTGLTLVTGINNWTDEQFSSLSGNCTNQWEQYDLLQNMRDNGLGVYVETPQNTNVLADGNNVTISNINLTRDSKNFKAYILAEVTGEVNTADPYIRNTANFPGGENRTKVIEQKEPTPNLEISKSVQNVTYGNAGNRYYDGDRVKYTVTVTNKGTGEANGVSLKDIFPSGKLDLDTGSITLNGQTHTFISKSAADYGSETTKSNTLDTKTELDFGSVNIPVNGTATITMEATVKAGVKGTIINDAEYTYNEETERASVEITRVPDSEHVTISKTADKNFAVAGDNVTYTIHLELKDVSGNAKAFPKEAPLYITDYIPNGMTFAADASTKAENEKSGIYVSKVTESGNEVVYAIVSDGTTTGFDITVVCKVNGDAGASHTTFTNTAKVNGNGGTVSAPPVHYGTGGEWTVTKKVTNTITGRSAENGGSIKASKGDNLEYEITITNNTVETKNEVEFVDALTNHMFGYKESYTLTFSGKDGVTGLETPVTKNLQYYQLLGKKIFVRAASGEIIGDGIEVTAEGFSMPQGSSLIVKYTVPAGGDNWSDTEKLDNKVTAYGISQTVTVTPGEDTDPDATAKPVQLEIEKFYSDSSGNELLSKEIVVKDLSTLEEQEIYYTVKVKNTSNKTYTATDTKIVDYIPKTDADSSEDDNKGSLAIPCAGIYDWSPLGNYYYRRDQWTEGNYNANFEIAKNTDENGNTIEYDNLTFVSLSAWKENSKGPGYDQWGNYGDAVEPRVGEGDVLRITSGNEYDSAGKLTIEPGGYIRATYRLRLSDETIAKIRAEADGGKDFTPIKFDNDVFFVSDTPFLDKYGNTVNKIAAAEEITIRPSSEHPGIKKTAEKSISPNGDLMDKKTAHVGDHLIWKITVQNGEKRVSNDGIDSMTDYTVTDIIPQGYKYCVGQSFENYSIVNATIHKKDGSEISKKIPTPSSIVPASDEMKNYVPISNMDIQTVTWTFTGDDYKLEAGDWLEFEVMTEPIPIDAGGSLASGIYYNKAQLRINNRLYEDTVTAGVVENGEITDGDSFQLNSVATSGTMSVTTSKGSATGGTENNTASAEAGETVRYTMTVKNESQYALENFAIINRLPYVGDHGVIVSGERGSEYDVTLPENYNMTAKITLDGKEINIPVADLLITTYTADADKKFTEYDEDWNIGGGSNWSDTHDTSTKLVRIQINPDKLKELLQANGITADGIPAGASISISYDAKLTEGNDIKDRTAWNSFAYSYDAGNSQNMAGEPSAVGVTINAKDDGKGTIKIKKVWASAGSKDAKTFYFAVYDGAYGTGKIVGGVQSVTLKGNADITKAVNADVTFTDIDYMGTDMGKSKRFYVYETNAQGIPIVQNTEANGYKMFTGFYRPSTGEGDTRGDTYTETDYTAMKIEAGSKVFGTNSKITCIADNNYAFLTKDLSMNKKSNSAIFSNLDFKDVEPELNVYGPYYADVATSYDKLNGDNLTTGVKTGDNEYDERDNNADANRSIKTSYNFETGKEITNSLNWNFGDGWGNGQGHTVATGFMAKIVGDGQAVKNVTWKLTSHPESSSDGVYMKLTDAEHTAMSAKLSKKGYTFASGTADAVFEDDSDTKTHGTKVYKIVQKEETAQSLENSAIDTNSGDDTTGENLGDDSADSPASVNDADDHMNMGDDKHEDLALNDDMSAAELAELQQVNGLTWSIKDTFGGTALTLGTGAEVYVGIILDGIYDKDMTLAADFKTMLNSEATAANDTSNKKADDYEDQIDVPSPNENGFGSGSVDPEPPVEPTIWKASSADSERKVGEYVMTNLSILFDANACGSTDKKIGEETFEYYISNNVNNGKWSNGAASGTALKYEAKEDGTLTVYVMDLGAASNADLSNGKELCITKEGVLNNKQNISSESAYHKNETSSKEDISLSLDVKAGCTYYAYVAGSKGRFVGAKFVPSSGN